MNEHWAERQAAELLGGSVGWFQSPSRKLGDTTSLHTSVPKESCLQAIASENVFSEGTGGALKRKVLVWPAPHPKWIPSPWVLPFTFPLVPVIWMMFSWSKSSTWDRQRKSHLSNKTHREIGVGGAHKPCPLYLQPTPCQVQLHGFQLCLGVTPLALHLLQEAGIGLQAVECAYSILSTTVHRMQVKGH